MGLREDDPVFYKVQMQKLIDKARKNGLKVDFSTYSGLTEETMKIYFRDPCGSDCAAATLVKKRRK